jgi:hypothetical protein
MGAFEPHVLTVEQRADRWQVSGANAVKHGEDGNSYRQLSARVAQHRQSDRQILHRVS